MDHCDDSKESLRKRSEEISKDLLRLYDKYENKMPLYELCFSLMKNTVQLTLESIPSYPEALKLIKLGIDEGIKENRALNRKKNIRKKIKIQNVEGKTKHS